MVNVTAATYPPCFVCRTPLRDTDTATAIQTSDSTTVLFACHRCIALSEGRVFWSDEPPESPAP